MSDLKFDEVAQDVVVIPRNEQITQLAEYAKKQIDIEDEIDRLEEQLSKTKDQLKDVSEFKIPELMQALSISEFKLDSGFKVSCKPYFTGKITDENSVAAFEWFETQGHGALVKHDLTVQVRMNNDKLLDDIRALAETLGLDVKEKLGVHYMTLTAFLKEQITSGKEVPRDLLGVYQGFRTKIGR